MVGLVFGSVFGLMFLGVPIAFAILACGIIVFSVTGMQPLLVVAQRDVGRAGATGIDLRDLAGDPRGRPSFHGTVELLAQHAYRPRILRGGFSGACRQLIDRARLIRQIDGAPIGRESALTRLKARRGQ